MLKASPFFIGDNMEDMIKLSVVLRQFKIFREILDRIGHGELSHEEALEKVDTMERLIKLLSKKIERKEKKNPWITDVPSKPYIYERSIKPFDKDDITPQWANEYMGDL